MAFNVLNPKWLTLAILSLGIVSGCCCQAVPLPGENQCPTDARRLYLSCGEEAVRRCPCGPDREYYGLKPTCWRTWPEGWHCGQYNSQPFPDGSSCAAQISEEPTRPESDLSNPFTANTNDQEQQPPASSPKQSTPDQPPAFAVKVAKEEAEDPKPAKVESMGPALSNRVKQHLIDSLRM